MRSTGPRPIVLVEGTPALVRRSLATALEAARLDGWTVVRGWGAPLTGERLLCSGTISNADDARRALLAAMGGAGIVANLAADRATVDRLVDELRSLGPVEHRVLG